MPKCIICPYFKYESKYHQEPYIRCEDGIVKFKTREAMKEYMQNKCGDYENYKKCSLVKKITEGMRRWESSKIYKQKTQR